MIILAATPNEKGSQLEALTQRLLRHRGYENCTTNVMANGAEIDVRGELPLRGLGADRRQKLICECKAHKAVVDMTQWCKFLGKVFHQEVCEGLLNQRVSEDACHLLVSVPVQNIFHLSNR